MIRSSTLDKPADLKAPRGSRNAAKHGEVGNGRESRGCNTTSTEGKSTVDYTLRRLTRDIADESLPVDRRDELESLLSEIEAGLSVNKAAIKAGYRKVKSPLEKAIAIVGQLDDSAAEQFAKWFESYQADPTTTTSLATV